MAQLNEKFPVDGELTASGGRAKIYRQTLERFFGPVAWELYKDKTVTEILINGHDQIFVERKGQLQKLEKPGFPSEAALQAAVNNVAEYVNRRLDDRHHSMDARLPEPECFRIHVIGPPCSRNGIVVSIRKFSQNELTIEELVRNQSISEPASQFLDVAVRLHRNILVSGGTGSGKTSMLNALSASIPTTERIVVIEDSSELRLRQPHTIYLESRPARRDGSGAVTIRDLFVDSLRMRPDRIIVGEVRRGEALDLVQSMLSGHDGAMSTVHASSASLALIRLETLCLMTEIELPVYVARTQVASAIHLIVHVARLSSGVRRVTEITEVRGLDSEQRYVTSTLFRRARESDSGVPELLPTGEQCQFADDVLESGAWKSAPLCIDLFRDRKVT